uniref:Uncharacterized protein n=1 Tax=Manihot esculenta TaxID=3983 RepID=A0A2C9WNR9_MANES
MIHASTIFLISVPVALHRILLYQYQSYYLFHYMYDLIAHFYLNFTFKMPSKYTYISIYNQLLVYLKYNSKDIFS